MSIAFRAAGTANAGPLTASPGLPAGTAADDVLIAVVTGTGNADFTVGGGGTWTRFAFNNPSGTRRIEMFWSRFVAGDAAPTFTIPVSNVILARIAGWSGCITAGTPIDQVSAFTNQTTTTLTYAAITPTVPDTELVLAGAIVSNTTVSGYSGANPVPSERFDSGAATGSTAQVHLASGAKNDTATSGSRTASRASGTAASGTLQLNLLPVPEGGGHNPLGLLGVG